MEISGLPWVMGMGISIGIPVARVWVWDGYGDCDESPWVCGDFE